MARIEAPYHPIIYLRGYAMTQGEIDATVATPYMGFNLGATKVRQDWKGQVRRHVFESALVRLMKDHGYRDSYGDGREREGELPARSVVIYRYYEGADSDLGGGDAPSIQEAARGLGKLVLRVRDQVCGDDAEARAAFRVYLVAHSMGGLVCRGFLQNPATRGQGFHLRHAAQRHRNGRHERAPVPETLGYCELQPGEHGRNAGS